MSEERNTKDCREFQAQLADLIGSGEDAKNHPHVKKCALCRALLADLETIAEAARQLLPVGPPKEDLWERIESAIEQEKGTENGK
ncbi:MAG TPA: hypothetical protein VND90_08050 [Terracidiphilus sp.]|nr:hypothetical protein [Terracidiphilus sp.]